MLLFLSIILFRWLNIFIIILFDFLNYASIISIMLTNLPQYSQFQTMIFVQYEGVRGSSVHCIAPLWMLLCSHLRSESVAQ